MPRELTPNALRLVEQFGGDATALGAHLREENRYHATGHGYRDPEQAAAEMVFAYQTASDEQIAHCREVSARLRAELGIGRNAR